MQGIWLPILDGPGRGFLWPGTFRDLPVWFGNRRRAAQQAVFKFVLPGAHTLDVGSGDLLLPLIAARATGDRGEVVILRDSERARRSASRVLQRNKIRNGVVGAELAAIPRPMARGEVEAVAFLRMETESGEVPEMDAIATVVERFGPTTMVSARDAGSLATLVRRLPSLGETAAERAEIGAEGWWTVVLHGREGARRRADA